MVKLKGLCYNKDLWYIGRPIASITVTIQFGTIPWLSLLLVSLHIMCRRGLCSLVERVRFDSWYGIGHLVWDYWVWVWEYWVWVWAGLVGVAGLHVGKMAAMLKSLGSKKEVDSAIKTTEDKVLVLRFGKESDSTCLKLDDIVS